LKCDIFKIQEAFFGLLAAQT